MRGANKRGSLRRPNPRGNRVSFIFCDFFIKKTPDSRRHAIPALRPYTLPVKNSPGGQPHLPQITPKGGYILQVVKNQIPNSIPHNWCQQKCVPERPAPMR